MLKLLNNIELIKINHKKINFILLIEVLILITIGLILVGSASLEKSLSVYGTSSYLLTKQIIFLLIGLLGAIGLFFIPIKQIFEFSRIILLIGLLLLAIVLLVGREVNGSMRWVSLGFLNIQVSEISKILIIIYLASYAVRYSYKISTQWNSFLKPMIILSLASLLLLCEPDLGTVIVLMVSSMGIFFLAGVRIKQFLFLIISLSFCIVVMILSKPYRIARIVSFIDPWSDAYGKGYQLTQALMGYGRGGWFGTGLGSSVQKLFYLPEAHTDFIFVILAEEFGVLGCIFVILMFLIIFFRIINIAFICKRKKLMFHSYLAYGLSFLFIIQAFINISISVGLLPTKGLTLPLVSYGGSSLISNLLAFAIIFRIDYEQKKYHLIQSN